MTSIAIIDSVTFYDDEIKELESLGEFTDYGGAPKSLEESIARVKNQDIVIASGHPIPAEAIEQADRLKMIAVYGTGYDHVPMEACRKKGVIVTNVPGYGAAAVAEHSFGLLLAVVRKIPQANQHVKSGHWKDPGFKAFELDGKTIGLIGAGPIGAHMAKLANGFGMKVLATTANPSAERAEKLGVEFVGLDELLAKSDVISIHASLNDKTESMFGKEEFGKMKDGAVLINTARAKIVEERYLIEAIRSGKLAGAGLDVLEKEPPEKDNPLCKMDNVIITPHIGYFTIEAKKRCTDGCIDNIESFLEGKTQNVVE